MLFQHSCFLLICRSLVRAQVEEPKKQGVARDSLLRLSIAQASPVLLRMLSPKAVFLLLQASLASCADLAMKLVPNPISGFRRALFHDH